jgi:hypothetical protein
MITGIEIHRWYVVDGKRQPSKVWTDVKIVKYSSHLDAHGQPTGVLVRGIKQTTPYETWMHLGRFDCADGHTTQWTEVRSVRTVDVVVPAVPAAFYDDHKYRDCSSGAEIKRTSKGVLVWLTWEAYEDLLSDAEYYSTAARDMGPEYLGLQASARATIKRLKNIDSAKLAWLKEGLI